MESETPEMGSSSGAAGSVSQANPRWNPTKDQINILENMYKQGVRTPSADQIQQITARLKAFGDIEGKNVFYWFQNHKARQRQKQKQETFDSITRYLYKSNQPMFLPPSCPNVVFYNWKNSSFQQQSATSNIANSRCLWHILSTTRRNRVISTVSKGVNTLCRDQEKAQKCRI